MDKKFSLKYLLCEPSVPWVEHLLSSILYTYNKLRELGFTYYNGKVTVIEIEEGESHV